MGRISDLYIESEIFLLQPVDGWERNFRILIAPRALAFTCLMCESHEWLDEEWSLRTFVESRVGKLIPLYVREGSGLCALRRWNTM